jgi:NADPH2:quinone reductase
MKAVGLYRSHSGQMPPQLVDIDIATPTPGPHDLLVAVVATSIGPLDCRQRNLQQQCNLQQQQQQQKIDTPVILGWDCAGVVEAVGADVTLFKRGDRVFYAGAIDRPGSNAELQLVDEQLAGHMPQGLLFAEAAALPLSSITAWETLFNRLHISSTGADAGKRLLIVGAAGGVGSVATQLAKRLGKLEVIATASRTLSAQWCRTQGADYVIDHHGDMATQLAKIGIAQVDYIACFQQITQHFATLAQLIKPRGSIVTTVEHDAPLAVDRLQYSNASIGWEFPLTRAAAPAHRCRNDHQLLNHIAVLADNECLTTTLQQDIRGINAANLSFAHTLVASGRAVGKIVLSGFHR